MLKKLQNIVLLKSVTDAHKANLAQDFPKLKDAAYSDKINRTVSAWFEKKRKETFIRIDPDYTNCPQLKSWAGATAVAAN
jgi:peptidyl-prolyl cis-trans isomerase SurA